MTIYFYCYSVNNVVQTYTNNRIYIVWGLLRIRKHLFGFIIYVRITSNSREISNASTAWVAEGYNSPLVSLDYILCTGQCKKADFPLKLISPAGSLDIH